MSFIEETTGIENGIVTGKDGLTVTRILSAMKESSKKGEPVYI
jgi:hypothetical protein